MSEFRVFQLEGFEYVEQEPMGCKPKHWYKTTLAVPELEPNKSWLFKVPPPRFPGEIWSEKIAAEIGAQMGLPIARVELASLATQTPSELGTICQSFADPRDWPAKSLEHGNELMEVQVKRGSYVLHKREKQVGLDAVFDYLRAENIKAPLDAADHDSDGAFFFTGYLVFDALIGNVDRHHQNWGIVRLSDEIAHLAPTYDHGASLGRELQCQKSRALLDNKQIEHYAAKARAKIVPPGQFDRTTPIRVLDFLSVLDQDHALCFWLEKALTIDATFVEGLFDRLPPGWASPDAKKFAVEFTRFNRDRLCELHKEKC